MSKRVVGVGRRGEEERKSLKEMKEGGGAAGGAEWQKYSRHFRCPSNLEGRMESGFLGIVKSENRESWKMPTSGEAAPCGTVGLQGTEYPCQKGSH